MKVWTCDELLLEETNPNESVVCVLSSLIIKKRKYYYFQFILYKFNGFIFTVFLSEAGRLDPPLDNVEPSSNAEASVVQFMI